MRQPQPQGGQREQRGWVGNGGEEPAQHPDSQRREEPHATPFTDGQGQRRGGFDAGWDEDWLSVAARLCRVDDGLPARLGRGGTRTQNSDAAQLKAYGNAIVPQVAYEIFEAINIYEREHYSL